MSEAQLFLHDTSVCLITKLVDQLVSMDQRRLEECLVILPTQRLATYVLGQIAAQKGAFFPPKITTLESIIRDHAKANFDLNPASESTIDFILTQKLKQADFKFVRSGAEREIRLILGELYDNNLRDNAQSSIIEHLQQDIHKHETHLQSIIARIDEIFIIFDALESELEKKRLAVRQKIHAMTAQRLAEHWDEFKQKSPGDTFLVGYTSLAASWQPLVDCMSRDSRSQIYLSLPPKTYQDTTPLQNLIDRFQKDINTVHKIEPSGDLKQDILLVEAKDPIFEVETSIAIAKKLIDDGHSPASIAILVTQEGQYQNYLRQALKGIIEGSNVALTSPLSSTSLGSWLIALMNLSIEPFSLQSLMSWLDNPISRTWFSETELLEEIDTEQVLENLSKLEYCHSWHQLISRLENSSLQPLCSRIFDYVKDFSNPTKLSLHDWLQRLATLISRFNGIDFIEDGFKEFAETQITDFFEQTIQLGEHSHNLISASDFWQFIKNHLFSIELRTTGEPLCGLQVLSLAESRFFPFDTVIVIGCNEGFCPKALPKDELCDDYLKQHMGLPGWGALEAMEDQTFHLLRERIPQLILLRPHSIMGEIQVRSRFIEKLSTEISLPIYQAEQLSFNRHPIAEKAMDRLQDKQEYIDRSIEGQVTDLSDDFWTAISATSLERIIRCPYRFLMSKLQVKDNKPASFEQDAKKQGEWLHAILEAFFTGSHKGRKLLDHWNFDETISFDEYALNRLMKLTHLLSSSPKELESPLYFHLRYFSWPAFIKHIKRVYEHKAFDLINLGKREAAIGTKDHEMIASRQVRGIRRQFFGSIDSIDHSNSFSLVTDYKRASVPDKKDFESGLSPQLAFYAMALQQQNDTAYDHMIIGYWNIIKGQWVPHSSSKSIREHALKLGLVSKQSLDLDEIVKTTQNLWQNQEESIELQGRFFADSRHCGLCNYADICRKDDPVISLSQALATEAISK